MRPVLKRGAAIRPRLVAGSANAFPAFTKPNPFFFYRTDLGPCYYFTRKYSNEMTAAATKQVAKEINQVNTGATERLTLNPVVNWTDFKFNPKLLDLADQILKLNLLEHLELTKILQTRLQIPESLLYGGIPMGVPAGMPTGPQQAGPQAQSPQVAAGGAATPAPAQKKEEAKPSQTVFDLSLTAVDAAGKFKILKEVRALIPGMTLQESKTLVEELPSQIKKGVPKEEAEQLVKKFKELGGTLVMK